MSDRTDFNDMAAVCGIDAVKAEIVGAVAAAIDAQREDAALLPLLVPEPVPLAPEVTNSHYRDVNAWPDPLPLPNGLPPVMPFDFNLLPEALRPWIADVANRVQCPPDFPAVGAVIAFATVVGRKIGIRPKRRDDWLEVPNLWGAIVGRPGVMKSPALRAALNPLTRLEAIASQGYDELVLDWGRGAALHKMKADAKTDDARKRVKKRS